MWFCAVPWKQHVLGGGLGRLSHARWDEPIRLTRQVRSFDDELLAGAVLQYVDWLRAYRHGLDTASWDSAGHTAETEHYIARIRHRPVQPRSYQAMVRCMAEDLRGEKREWMRGATATSFGLYDRDGGALLV